MTSEERREVARKLREAAKGDGWLDVDVCHALERVGGFDRKPLGEVLADLIEPSDESYRRGFDEGFASADDWYAQHTDEELAEHGLKRERTCKYTTGYVGDLSMPTCSACGYEAGYGEVDVYSDGAIRYDGKYCTNCGAKVVDE